MNDGRRGKGRTGLRDPRGRLFGDQGHDHELKTDQRARRPANDQVEAVPLAQF
jgi:hypothetical protein